MGSERKYDNEFKKQAVKLAKEVGTNAAVAELGIPKSTLLTWVRKAKAGEIDTGSGTRLPEESLNLAQQLQAANKRIKELEKKNRELEELNEFLEEASAFSQSCAAKTTVGSRERRTAKVHCHKDR